MEREASRWVGLDAIAEGLLGVLETLEVGPERGKRKVMTMGFLPTVSIHPFNSSIILKRFLNDCGTLT